MTALSTAWRELPALASWWTWHDTTDTMASELFDVIEARYATTASAYDNVWIEELLEATTERAGDRVRFVALALDDLLDTIDRFTDYPRR